MELMLSGQVQDPEIVRENFNKIRQALKNFVVTGAVQFKGTWNAFSNETTSVDPALNAIAIPAAGTANAGYYFIIDTDGTTAIDGINSWKIKDWIVSTGAAWVKVDNNQPGTGGGGGGGGGTWGSITGLLADQLDLAAVLGLPLSALNTVIQDSLVAAINEVLTKVNTNYVTQNQKINSLAININQTII